MCYSVNSLKKLFWNYDISQKTETTKTQDSFLTKYGISYIYHMTHYLNLESILDKGLFSHNNRFTSVHIDNSDVNIRRNKIEPIYQQNLHSYVPFYFNPKNPMLYVNKDIQREILILAFNKNLLLTSNTIFTDGNAARNTTRYFNNLTDLDQINWDCINSKYWIDFTDGKREVMAEVLVPHEVSISHLQKIYCYDEKIKEYISRLCKRIHIEANTRFYF